MGFFDILNAFVPLIIIVALLYGVLVVVKKYGYNIRGKEYSPVNVKILTTKMIMPKRFVSVINVEGKILVLGVSEHSVNLIKELENNAGSSAAIEPGKWDASLKSGFLQGGKGSFLDILKKNIGIK